MHSMQGCPNLICVREKKQYFNYDFSKNYWYTINIKNEVKICLIYQPHTTPLHSMLCYVIKEALPCVVSTSVSLHRQCFLFVSFF